jgi:glycosyltransferase involved in cell wall biosynthesis
VEQPLVSVILPFYHAEETLAVAIDSIINQSLTRWELLIINNNANEKSVSIAEQFALKDTRIRMIHEAKQGIAFALNTGIKASHAELIARMDADDVSHPDRLKSQTEFLNHYPDIDVVSCQTVFRSTVENNLGYQLYVEWQNSIVTPEEHALNRFVESPLAHPTVMFRKSLIEKYGMYDTGNVPEDYELWLRWMDKGVRFFKIPEPLLQWNDHHQRLSRVDEHYKKEAFFKVKCFYLAKWAARNVDKNKKIVVCGSSNTCRKRAQLLEANGLNIYGFTDVKISRNKNIRFIPIDELSQPGNWFLINMITKRGVGPSIRKYFTALGFHEGKDFILAG